MHNRSIGSFRYTTEYVKYLSICYTAEWHLSVRVLISLMSAHKRTLMDRGLPIFTIHWLIQEIHCLYAQLITLPLYDFELHMRLSLLTCRASCAGLMFSRSCILVCAGCHCTESRIIRGLPYYRPVYSFLKINI